MITAEERERIARAMPANESPLVIELRDAQLRLEWTDTRMAQELGIPPPAWSRLRNGERRAGLKILRGVARCRELAHLDPELDLFLGRDRHNRLRPGRRGTA